MEAKHKFILENGKWYIACLDLFRSFSARLKFFNDSGLCPHCNCNAKKELLDRKKKKIRFNELKKRRDFLRTNLNKNSQLLF